VEIAETPVREIMHTDYHRVHPDTPLSDIYRIIAGIGRKDIIVIDENGQFAGMVTELDLLSSIGPGMGIRSRKKTGCIECMIKSGAQRVREVMSRSHIIVPPTCTIEQAMVAMEKNRHPDVIVTDENGAAVGMVELADIIAFLVQRGEL
jgi:CBS domain-containing protein